MTVNDTYLFGPRVYHPDDESGSQLASDVQRLPVIMKEWKPAMWPALFDVSPVGSYNEDMKKAVLSESLAWLRELKTSPSYKRVLDAPARLGFVARSNVFEPAMSELLDIPDTQFGHAMADIGFGYTWGSIDQTRLCKACVRGSCAASMFTLFADYYKFLPRSPDVEPAMNKMADLITTYVKHVHTDHAAGGPERKIMDAWFMCIHATYFDIIRPDDGTLQCTDTELTSIKYRIVSTSFLATTLQFRAAQDACIENDHIITAVGITVSAMHDVCERRQDNYGNVYYNMTTIIGVHTGLESVYLLRRFCVDVWAWAVDHEADWAIHGPGRVLMCQIYAARYQSDKLLDNLNAPSNIDSASVDPYGDPVLNLLNPLPPSANPHDYSIRSRCRDKSRYDKLVASALTHFAACEGCQGYDNASWHCRVTLITAAFNTKYTHMDCMNSIATFMILTQPEEFWWAADPASRYTGPMQEWSTDYC